MNCEGCIYLGIEFENLRNYLDIPEWRDCKYPIPFHVTPKAAPMVKEHNCKVRRENEKG